MINRVNTAERLFKDGYNCSQAVFGAFCDLYDMDRDMALKLSASFGGGVGRMREVCGAVLGMSMIAGLETGTSNKMDDEGKKYNYDVVQKLSAEFKNVSGSIICRELLGLDQNDTTNTSPQKRNDEYYQQRPCVQLVKDAAGIIEQVLYDVSFAPVVEKEQREEVGKLANKIWHEHYDSIIGKDQVDYMLLKFQSQEAIKCQIENEGYQYYKLENLGGLAGYFSIHMDSDSLFLSKIYIDKKYRGRNYSRKIMGYLEQVCKENKLSKIWLTVNRENIASIAVYETLGFVKTRTQVADIGSGYVMDDYIMEKSLSL